jgi:hypothetical protein
MESRQMRRWYPRESPVSAGQREQAVRLARQIREDTGEKHGAVQRVARQLTYDVEPVRQREGGRRRRR